MTASSEAICFFEKTMKIKFEKSIRRLRFLYHISGIKIVWINPWGCMKSTNSVSNFFFDNHWWHHEESLLFLKDVCSIFQYKKKKKKKIWICEVYKKNSTWQRCKLCVNCVALFYRQHAISVLKINKKWLVRAVLLHFLLTGQKYSILPKIQFFVGKWLKPFLKTLFQHFIIVYFKKGINLCSYFRCIFC